jgi:hypothetical protein
VADTMSGWVAIKRGIFEHPFFAREPMSEREAWVWMITRAAWQDTRHKVGMDMVEVPRGAFMATLKEMQSVWMWRSDSRVRNFLKRLESERMVCCEIVVRKDARKTQVSICNYEQYQAIERAENVGKNAGGTRGPTHKRNKEQDNKEEEAKASKQIRGSRLPDDWFLPRSWGEWAAGEGYEIEVIRTQADNFKDYWKARAGPTASKLDWEATWRVWMRKTPKGKNNGNGYHINGNAPATSGDRFMDEIADIARARPSPGRLGH